MLKKLIILSTTCLLLSGCTLPQSAKIVTGGIVSTNTEEGTVQIKNYSFDPSDINTVGGGSIKITNNDTVTHSLTADDGSFDTGLIEPGANYQLMIPPKDGTFGFHCTPHPYMRGKLTVINSPSPTPISNE